MFSPAARGLSAEGRIILMILLILSNYFFKNKNPFLFFSDQTGCPLARGRARVFECPPFRGGLIGQALQGGGNQAAVTDKAVFAFTVVDGQDHGLAQQTAKIGIVAGGFSGYRD